ncbi:hypothetical protein [Rathayibacter tanaceti]|uniref:Uncharacterized protein n=1 Tax=Rathayibacter tanaceti TaxID=1671680 RepID=A0A166HS04_9MICO|nr:hypothetical protein [Rathayibacter tanaceti]KZX21074.1 hypothetical protein ACH61_01818 [Rathayibacter tanaceti]
MTAHGQLPLAPPRPTGTTALSPAQRAVWVASEVDPDAATDFHLGWTTHFTSAHDPARVADAVARVLRAEPRLSQTVVVDGGEPQWATCPAPDAPAVIDLPR